MPVDDPAITLSTPDVAALAQFFRTITAAGSFPPASGSYSGNVSDLICAVSHLDKMFMDSLDPPWTT